MSVNVSGGLDPHRYLLALSLLTNGQSTPSPTLPSLPLDDFSALLSPTAAELLESLDRTTDGIPSLDSTFPEFGLISALSSESLTPPLNLVAATDTRLSPKSNSQLYSQRLAALKVGKTYTRLESDRFASIWTKATTQPSYEQWKSLLTQEAKAIAQGQGNNRLSVLVGDSISMWFPSEFLPNDRLWLNQGISGDTSGGILKRLPAFSQTRPDTIYVLAGINDLRRGATNSEVLENLRSITRRLHSAHPNSRIVLQSLLPTRLPTIPNYRIRSLNQQLSQIAQQEGVAYLDLHSLFSDSEGLLRRDFTTDGLHLSRQGYQVWQQAIQYTEGAIALK